MRLYDLFYFSFKNLQRRKLRSWLTALGIVIGIASIVALTSISFGMQKAIEEAFLRMGENKIMILPGKTSAFLASAYIGKPFDDKDIERLKSIDVLETVVPMSYITLPTYFRNEEFPTIIIGIDISNGNLEDAGFEILSGRDFIKSDKGKCRAILGYQYATKAFSKEIDVGDKISIGKVECKVIGILKPTGSRIDDLSIYIPLDVLKKEFGVKNIEMIVCKVKDIEAAKRKVKEVLDKTRGEEGYTIFTPEQFAEQVKSILGIVSLIVIAIAAISLIVSSIGIMNTMYMAVTERTREIGLLKAIGAKNFEIMLLFLIESGLIGLIGGLIGVILGMLFAKIVEFVAISAGYGLFKAYFDPFSIISILLFSFIIGVISGILPARAAAKLNPVDALRYE